MSPIEEVRHEREELARVLKKHTGIRKIVEELYPDSAHFIYELLQNAEDTGATKASFTLTDSCLVFEHNGRPFHLDDVYAITDIGEGTKTNDDDAIGRFGVGFKAVFAYTETPRVWSPTYSFEITELVLPNELKVDNPKTDNTRFEFPFNNPKKAASDAFDEIWDGLNSLSETTLLFLTHIESISWTGSGNLSGEVCSVAHSEHHTEILKLVSNRTPTSSHFLRFTRPVEGLEKQKLAIAFVLELLPDLAEFSVGASLQDQFKIVPANSGRVAVFFPAEKENSGLRFHLHAPFVPELSRASIKETTTNEPLFKQLAQLIVSSLFVIRDIKLLTAYFLGVLPNLNNYIPKRYDCIREAIFTAMNEMPLTPTHSKTFSPAKYLLQAKAPLKALLSIKDLDFLYNYDNPTRENDRHCRKWAISANQRYSDVDRFLSCLAIEYWDIEQFLTALTMGLSVKPRRQRTPGDCLREPDPEFLGWITMKSEEWHQKLYATLYRELEPIGELSSLSELCIVKLNSIEYSVAKSCYFPASDGEQDSTFPRISSGVYTAGKSTQEQEASRALLEAIGVREVGEAVQIEAILKRRYRESDESGFPDWNTYKANLFRFISLVEDDPNHATIFSEYRICLGMDGAWYLPRSIFLDSPYLDTGLGAFFDALSDDVNCVGLSSRYSEAPISQIKLVAFFQQIGVQFEIGIERCSCHGNPKSRQLVDLAPGTVTRNQVDKDFRIANLKYVLTSGNLSLSRLVWKTLINAKVLDWTKASYRNNGGYPIIEAPSQLACLLRDSAWIPQVDGRFVRPAEAEKGSLPAGFEFDSGWHWLKGIGFGDEVSKYSDDHRRKIEVAIELGFEDDESFNDAKWFAALASNERQNLKIEYENRTRVKLPDQEIVNGERRMSRVAEQAADAPERKSEFLTRSVSIGLDAVKIETDPYLRQQYTNGDGDMICQICRSGLPFKLADGREYFEATEFLTELSRRHYQNYLALCPNHAAMFRHANGSRDDLLRIFLASIGQEVPVELAASNHSIYFTQRHFQDLRAVVEIDQTKVASKK